MSNTTGFNILSATTQEIFDYSARMVHRQMGPSISNDNTCAYRGEGGRRCAVGWLIPDEVYSWRMEGSTASFVADMLSKEGESQLAAVFGRHSGLLSLMQCAHDQQLRIDGWQEWFKRLRQVAKGYNLNTEVLDQLEHGTA